MKKNGLCFIISVLVGLMIIFIILGLPIKIYDHTKTSAVFTVSAICLVIGFLFPLIIYQNGFIVKRIDILLCGFLAFYLIDFQHLDMLSNLGYFCLLLLFCALRCLHDLNYVIIYKFVIISLFILSCYGYLQYFGCVPSNNKYFVLTGSYHNPAIFAEVMALLTGVVLGGFILYHN